ncbi:peptide chain release factor N(5)-glutamine methyltransferase [Myceligenerans salitolerans]|uniref:Peptide chain release factor N(5)-glutamine methyltransferase n=1 Tax=Myceligenerans salitolerans TaxID=1230528 RepID=A0ABS3I587_9MICO|nr:peptide chain release factor N(5)-glutamine methyltransferase [Myceligenerans salitolerans]MBO0608170.1 peptide chain release factor N(5)-glutamine methyltransferase [Myceligenerans salitolerans]
MSTTDQLITDAARVLSGSGVGSPRVDAELLLAYVLGVDPGEVRRRAVLGAPVADDARSRFHDVVARRAAREPLQHLTGVAHFRYLTLAVGPGVFVPRPETEQVAQVAIDEAAGLAVAPGRYGRADSAGPGAEPARDAAARGPVVVDLCTGSGAIALAVATEVPGSRVHAVELDARAHAWAVRNIDAVSAAPPRPPTGGTGGLVRLVRGDARTALRVLDGTVDVVVSNPPYVPPDAVPRDVEVAEHDPAVALYGLGADGLEVPRGIVAAAARLLRPGGLFVMEHAEVQSGAVRAMVDRTGAFESATTRDDLTGRPRMVVARRAARDESTPGS